VMPTNNISHQQECDVVVARISEEIELDNM
jgi:hypothetical protein